MNFIDDTIAAISTPVGQGGIGIVRLSGQKAVSIADSVFRPLHCTRPPDAASHRLVYGNIIDPADAHVVDEALLCVMRGPKSYTCEDVVEINCHGGIVAMRKALELVLRQGARIAEPGEFTKRAFLNGRLNLAQAEAVQDIISAKTEESMKIACEQLRGGLTDKLLAVREQLIEICAVVEAYIDFPEEDIETGTKENFLQQLGESRLSLLRLSATFNDARFFREGLSVAIVGRPNVGKSSLLNTLLMKDKAIVTALPGTTRDLIEDYLNINGLPIRIMDTAGIRNSDEIIEQEGIRRSLQAIAEADFIIALFDGSEPLRQDDRELLAVIADKKGLIVVSKADLEGRLSLEEIGRAGKHYLQVSTVTGMGIDDLKKAVFDANIHGWGEGREGVVVTNIRHKAALDRASESLQRAEELLSENRPPELFAVEMREALNSIGEITGTVTTDDVLERIFSSFCIGK